MRVRIALYLTLGFALAVLQPSWAENIVASAAAIVLECLPYLVASSLAAPLLRVRAPGLLAYAGCGCGSGPSARSIPAAVATAVLFNPFIAITRVLVASFIARRFLTPAHEHDATFADAFASLAPSALLAATASAIALSAKLSTQPTILQLLGGLMLGACASPCALGSVALAASLHPTSPIAAYAILATAGFGDVSRWFRHRATARHDALAYALLAAACALAVYDGGAQLVHPRLILALLACIPYVVILAFRSRGSRNLRARVVASALVAAVLVGAPTPSYHATETTLSDVFVGESLDFTGRYSRTAHAAFVERYAITCCRADATPIALELAQPLRSPDGAWMDVVGVIAVIDGRNVLRVGRSHAVAPPGDPFIYR